MLHPNKHNYDVRDWRWYANEGLMVGLALLSIPLVLALLAWTWYDEYIDDPYFDKHD